MGKHSNQLLTSYNNHAKDRENMIIQDWKEQERDKVLSYLSQGDRLLDLGAGTGQHAAFFQNQGIDVLCGDFSPEMIKACEQKGLRGQVMDFYSLDIDERLDAVWSMNALLHVPKADLPSILQQIACALKDKGIFYLGVYGGYDSEGIWENDVYNPKRFFSFYTNKHLKQVVSEHFTILDFDVIPMEKGPNYQALILRRTK